VDGGAAEEELEGVLSIVALAPAPPPYTTTGLPNVCPLSLLALNITCFCPGFKFGSSFLY
jgi:hypothetical protein